MKKRMWAVKDGFIYGYGTKVYRSWRVWVCEFEVLPVWIDYKRRFSGIPNVVQYATNISYGEVRTWQEAEGWLKECCPGSRIFWSRLGWSEANEQNEKVSHLQPGVWRAEPMLADGKFDLRAEAEEVFDYYPVHSQPVATVELYKWNGERETGRSRGYRAGMEVAAQQRRGAEQALQEQSA